MPKHTRAWSEVRKGTGLTNRHWEWLAGLEITDPVAFDHCMKHLAFVKVSNLRTFVEIRREWEATHTVKGGLSPLQENEPFLGEPYDS